MLIDVKTCSIYWSKPKLLWQLKQREVRFHKCLHKVSQFKCKLVYKLGWLQVSSKCFPLYFLKEIHLGICRMESFAGEPDYLYS